jgi:hypothetical protein
VLDARWPNLLREHAFSRAERVGALATNLFVIDADGKRLARITSEHNGGEEPSVDPRDRAHRLRALVDEPVLRERFRGRRLHDRARRALARRAREPVHAITVQPDGDGLRLAGGYPRVRASTMAYQPLRLEDGHARRHHRRHAVARAAAGRVHLVVYRRRFAEPVAFPSRPRRCARRRRCPTGGSSSPTTRAAAVTSVSPSWARMAAAFTRSWT